MDPHEAQLIRRYLLGQLSSDERAQIEQRLLAESDFFQEILIGEEELIDDYVGHQLSETEIQAFESNFLITPERWKQLRFARGLAKYLNETNEAAVDEAESESSSTQSGDYPFDSGKADPRKKRKFFSFFPVLSPTLSYALAAVILVSVVGIAWLAMRNTTTPSGRPGSFVTIILGPGLTRAGGEITRAKLLSENDQVVARVIVPTVSYQAYRTRLLKDDRSELWASGELMAVEESGTRVVVSTIPAGLLVPGDYRMALSGRATDGTFEDVATYPFRVIR